MCVSDKLSRTGVISVKHSEKICDTALHKNSILLLYASFQSILSEQEFVSKVDEDQSSLLGGVLEDHEGRMGKMAGWSRAVEDHVSRTADGNESLLSGLSDVGNRVDRFLNDELTIDVPTGIVTEAFAIIIFVQTKLTGFNVKINFPIKLWYEPATDWTANLIYCQLTLSPGAFLSSPRSKSP